MYEPVEKKRTKDFGLLLKQGKVTISIKALTKVEFFYLVLGPWDEKRVRVYGNAVKDTQASRRTAGIAALRWCLRKHLHNADRLTLRSWN